MSSSDIIPVYFSCDNNYVAQLCTVIKSITSNTNSNIHFIILHLELSGESKYNIEKTSANHRVSFVGISKWNSHFENFCMKQNHISIAACYRYLIPILDFEYNKGIYLDCDIVVLDDIKELYNIDLKNNYLAGTDDFLKKKHLRLISVDRYFNSGVLLLNLKKLKEDNISFKLFETTKALKDKIKYLDQDILNIVLKNSVSFLPIRWGITAPPFRKKIKSNFLSQKEILEAVYDPAIVHFTGPDKPWTIPYGITAHPWAPAYFYYLKQTTFAKNTEAIKEKFNAISRLLWYWKRHLLFFTRPFFYKMRLLHLCNKKKYEK